MFFRGNATINLQCQISKASFFKALPGCREAVDTMLCVMFTLFMGTRT